MTANISIHEALDFDHQQKHCKIQFGIGNQSEKETFHSQY